MRFRFAFERIEKFLYALWRRILRRKFISEQLRKLCNIAHFRRIWLGMNTIQERTLASLFRFTRDNLRDRSVRSEHKVLDHTHRTESLFAYRLDRLTILEPESEFLRFKVDRTCLASP